jgi:hypothetical protein
MSAFAARPVFVAILWLCCVMGSSTAFAAAPQTRAITTDFAVGPQYDSTHVYVTPSDLDAFVSSFVATLGGHASKPIVSTVTPTPSSTQFQYVMSPVGTLSVFAYLTPVPYPFGLERTGYLVTDLNQAIAAARTAGASVIVEPFKDPIGMDAIIEWPGGIKMQLYWHFKAPSYGPLASVPENRIYVSPDRIDSFVNGFIHFSRGKVLEDVWHADGAELGSPGETYRRIRIESNFGKLLVMATAGHLPFPFGLEISGYEVGDLNQTLDAAAASGVQVLAAPRAAAGRNSAIVQFPGGFIAEIHSRQSGVAH